MSARGDVFVLLDDVRNPHHVEASLLQPLHPRLIQHGHCLYFCTSGVFKRVRRRQGRRPSLYASGVSPDAFVGPDSGAARTRTHSHPGSVTGLFVEPLLNSVAAQVTEASFVSSSLAVSKALSSRSGSKPLAMSSSPLAGPSGYHPVRRCGRGGALRPPRALEDASASRVVRGRLLLRNLRVFGSGSHRLP